VLVVVLQNSAQSVTQLFLSFFWPSTKARKIVGEGNDGSERMCSLPVFTYSGICLQEHGRSDITEAGRSNQKSDEFCPKKIFKEKCTSLSAEGSRFCKSCSAFSGLPSSHRVPSRGPIVCLLSTCSFSVSIFFSLSATFLCLRRHRACAHPTRSDPPVGLACFHHDQTLDPGFYVLLKPLLISY
jgi:hypothetical protein